MNEEQKDTFVREQGQNFEASSENILEEKKEEAPPMRTQTERRENPPTEPANDAEAPDGQPTGGREAANTAGGEMTTDPPVSDSAAAPDGQAVSLSDARRAELVANPMFIHFARGRVDSLDILLREFEQMLAAGGQAQLSRMAASDAARVTPCVHTATADIALSERQRALARAAGMSYREYYELARTVPGSNLFDRKGE